MSYIAFALKYRPQKFDQVIGQEHVVVSLRNAILKGRIHHAYLFSGPRGIGKTSLARIFAKSINCFEGPTINPCGKCTSCVEISRGVSLDIIEIDGASNRGIDDIRTLRENVKLSPARARYKIYIIDEVHQITTDGFNALLKTLEEPPSHVKFIFATTHPQKVLPTILSRCQKFQFNLISVEEIVAKLKKIAKAENLDIEERLFYAIGRAAEGSIRDAESLLDQLAPVVLEKGTVEDILSFLGIIDEETLNQALQYIIEKDLTGILSFVDKVIKGGKDIGVFVNALIEHLRILLLVKVSVRSFKELIEVSPQTKDFILKLSTAISVPAILQLIDSFIEAKSLAHRINTIRVPLELALVKSLYQEKQEKEEKSLGNSSQEKRINPVISQERPRTGGSSSTVGEAVGDRKATSRTDGQLPEKSNPTLLLEDAEHSINLEGIDDIDDIQIKSGNPEEEIIDNSEVSFVYQQALQRLQSSWSGILSEIRKTRAALSSHLSFSQPIRYDGELVMVGFPKKDSFHKEVVEHSKNIKFIQDIFSQSMGSPVGIKFIFSEQVIVQSDKDLLPADESQSLPPPKGVQEASPQSNEFINDLLDTFGGKLHTGDS